MTVQSCTADAVIIGGGFYGSAIAIYLAKTRGLRRLILLEREPELLIRASYNNQARVHNGYTIQEALRRPFVAGSICLALCEIGRKSLSRIL